MMIVMEAETKVLWKTIIPGSVVKPLPFNGGDDVDCYMILTYLFIFIFQYVLFLITFHLADFYANRHYFLSFSLLNQGFLPYLD